MKQLIKKFTFYGLLLGVLYGLGTIVYVYFNLPGIPGIYEVGLQIVFILFHGMLGALAGFVLGIVTAFILRTIKKQKIGA